MPGWLILIIALVISCVVAAALNFTIEKVAYRPLRNSPKLAPLITAIGMSILLQTLAMIIFKPNYKPYPTLLPSAPFQVGGAVITATQIMILGLTAVSLAVLMYLVNYTKLGRAMRATAENPRVAALMGVRPDTVISATFIIGAVLATIAGVMYASNYGTVQHTMGFLPGLKAFTAAVFGGIGNLAGAVVGGILLGLIEVDRLGLHRRADRRRAGQPLLRHLRLHRADHHADAAALRPAGRARGGPGLKEHDHDGLHQQAEQVRGLRRCGALALLILPLLLQTQGNAWVRIADIALLYVLLALGLNIVVGYAGLLDLGYVAFYAIGAYLFGLLASPHLTDTFPWHRGHVPGRACTCRCGS